MQRAVNKGRTCSVEDCDEAAHCKGMCQRHYRWMRAHGTTELPELVRINEGPCSIEGCTNPAATRGMCYTHYGRFLRRRKNANPDRPICRWPFGVGCTRTATAQGFCEGHYMTVRTNAAHEHLLEPEARGERCLYPECPDPQYARGLCRSHGDMSLRGTLPVPEIPPLDLGSIPQRARYVRLMRGMTLEDVGKEMGVTRERVRQIESALPQGKPEAVGRYFRAIGTTPEQFVSGVFDPETVKGLMSVDRRIWA